MFIEAAVLAEVKSKVMVGETRHSCNKISQIVSNVIRWNSLVWWRQHATFKISACVSISVKSYRQKSFVGQNWPYNWCVLPEHRWLWSVISDLDARIIISCIQCVIFQVPSKTIWEVGGGQWKQASHCLHKLLTLFHAQNISDRQDRNTGTGCCTEGDVVQRCGAGSGSRVRAHSATHSLAFWKQTLWRLQPTEKYLYFGLNNAWLLR